MAERRDSPYSIQVLEKAFALLDLLSAGPGTLTELSTTLRLNKSGTFRLLRNLERFGYATRDPDGAHYHLGPRLLELGCRLLPAEDLLGQGRSALHRLVTATGETGELCIREGYDSLVIASEAGPQLTTALAPVGMRVPIHCGASAKVLLAHAPTRLVEPYLAQNDLARLTENTIATREGLRTELAAIRRRGFAESWGEVDTSLNAVAAPVRGREGRVVAAVAAIAPAARCDSERLDDLRDQVLAITADLSRRLGSSAD